MSEYVLKCMVVFFYYLSFDSCISKQNTVERLFFPHQGPFFLSASREHHPFGSNDFCFCLYCLSWSCPFAGQLKIIQFTNITEFHCGIWCFFKFTVRILTYFSGSRTLSQIWRCWYLAQPLHTRLQTAPRKAIDRVLMSPAGPHDLQKAETRSLHNPSDPPLQNPWIDITREEADLWPLYSWNTLCGPPF